MDAEEKHEGLLRKKQELEQKLKLVKARTGLEEEGQGRTPEVKDLLEREKRQRILELAITRVKRKLVNLEVEMGAREEGERVGVRLRREERRERQERRRERVVVVWKVKGERRVEERLGEGLRKRDGEGDGVGRGGTETRTKGVRVRVVGTGAGADMDMEGLWGEDVWGDDFWDEEVSQHQQQRQQAKQQQQEPNVAILPLTHYLLRDPDPTDPTDPTYPAPDLDPFERLEMAARIERERKAESINGDDGWDDWGEGQGQGQTQQAHETQQTEEGLPQIHPLPTHPDPDSFEVLEMAAPVGRERKAEIISGDDERWSVLRLGQGQEQQAWETQWAEQTREAQETQQTQQVLQVQEQQAEQGQQEQQSQQIQEAQQVQQARQVQQNQETQQAQHVLQAEEAQQHEEAQQALENREGQQTQESKGLEIDDRKPNSNKAGAVPVGRVERKGRLRSRMSDLKIGSGPSEDEVKVGNDLAENKTAAKEAPQIETSSLASESTPQQAMTATEEPQEAPPKIITTRTPTTPTKQSQPQPKPQLPSKEPPPLTTHRLTLVPRPDTDLFSPAPPPGTLLILACSAKADWRDGVSNFLYTHYPKAHYMLKAHCKSISTITTSSSSQDQDQDQNSQSIDPVQAHKDALDKHQRNLVGTALLIKPTPAAFAAATTTTTTNTDKKQNENNKDLPYFIGCLFLTKESSKAYRDPPVAILKATRTAMADLMRQVAEHKQTVAQWKRMNGGWARKVKGKTTVVGPEMRMARRDVSTKFGIKWEMMREVLEGLEVVGFEGVSGKKGDGAEGGKGGEIPVGVFDEFVEGQGIWKGKGEGMGKGEGKETGNQQYDEEELGTTWI